MHFKIVFMNYVLDIQNHRVSGLYPPSTILKITCENDVSGAGSVSFFRKVEEDTLLCPLGPGGTANEVICF
jgi:hypothetical protein